MLRTSPNTTAREIDAVRQRFAAFRGAGTDSGAASGKLVVRKGLGQRRPLAHSEPIPLRQYARRRRKGEEGPPFGVQIGIPDQSALLDPRVLTGDEAAWNRPRLNTGLLQLKLPLTVSSLSFSS